MHHTSVSGCVQTSAPTNQPTQNSHKGNAYVPQSRSDWSSVLSSIPDSWILTPVKDKRPLRPDWQDETEIARDHLLDLLDKGQKLTSSQGKEWHCHWTGIGLRLGTISDGLMAIDADGELAEAQLQEISGGDLPLTPGWTSGKKRTATASLSNSS